MQGSYSISVQQACKSCTQPASKMIVIQFMTAVDRAATDQPAVTWAAGESRKCKYYVHLKFWRPLELNPQTPT